MKPLVLFAEDDPNDILIFKHHLDKRRLEVEFQFVHDGSIAIAWLAGEGVYADRDLFPIPSLIITDLKMSELGGFAVLRYVRDNPKLRHIPVIVHSSSKLSVDIDMARTLGATEYIVKDSSFKPLLDCLALYASGKIVAARAQ
jgi:CheY-like chemotaxis protein